MLTLIINTNLFLILLGNLSVSLIGGLFDTFWSSLSTSLNSGWIDLAGACVSKEGLGSSIIFGWLISTIVWSKFFRSSLFGL